MAIGTGAPAERAGADASWLEARRVIALLWRERLMLLAVFACVAVLGLLVAFKQTTHYQAHSSLLIRLGSEYVYNPAIGDAARGAIPDTDQVIQSEVEILGSAALKDRVIRDIGLPSLFPDLANAYARADAYKRRDIQSVAIRRLESNLKIASAPATAVVRLTYSHANPQMAATVLNTLIDEYLNYRRTVLVDQNASVIAQQRRAFQQRLNVADNAYQQFLAENQVSDFDTEKTSLAQIYAQLLSDHYNVGVRLSEVEGRLGVTSREAAIAPAEVGLYRDIDHTAADKLVALRLERRDLLSRYRPNTGPVQDLDRRIAELEAAVGSGQVVGPGARRVGINPVYQTLQTEQNQLKAEAASLRNRQRALGAELQQVASRRLHLNRIEPRYQELARQRDVLSINVRNLTAREQESLAQQAVAQGAADNVRVVERAYVPTRGTSLKKPLAVLAILFAAFCAVCAGLLRVFLTGGAPPRRPLRKPPEPPQFSTAPLSPA